MYLSIIKKKFDGIIPLNYKTSSLIPNLFIKSTVMYPPSITLPLLIEVPVPSRESDGHVFVYYRGIHFAPVYDFDI